MRSDLAVLAILPVLQELRVLQGTQLHLLHLVLLVLLAVLALRVRLALLVLVSLAEAREKEVVAVVVQAVVDSVLALLVVLVVVLLAAGQELTGDQPSALLTEPTVELQHRLAGRIRAPARSVRLVVGSPLLLAVAFLVLALVLVVPALQAVEIRLGWRSVPIPSERQEQGSEAKRQVAGRKSVRAHSQVLSQLLAVVEQVVAVLAGLAKAIAVA